MANSDGSNSRSCQASPRRDSEQLPGFSESGIPDPTDADDAERPPALPLDL
jgi:hypothetical protein